MPPAGRQRAWAGALGRVSVILVAGEEYAERIRPHLPLFPCVLHVTNGEQGTLLLSREKDQVTLRMKDGKEFSRIDIWQSGDLMTRLAAMPALDRARFRYPDFVLSGSAVEFTVTFDPSIALDNVGGVWVKLQAIPSQGIWLRPLPEARATPARRAGARPPPPALGPESV